MKKNLLYLVLSVVVLSIAACSGKPGSGDTASGRPADTAALRILKDAYRWGYPMLAMTLNNQNQYETTTNAFYNMKKAADEKSQRDKGFNAETLYSAGALDLSAEPVVFTMPPTGDRFIVFPIQDAWGNIDNVIGTRTVGNQGGNFLISGPGWKGEVPAGMKHYEVKTNVVFLPGRSMVKGIDDAKQFANTVQDQYTITPLSRWGKGAPNPNRDSEKNPLQADPSKNYSLILSKMSPLEYFTLLNDLLKKNPPYDYDKPVLEQFASVGVGPGQIFDTTWMSTSLKDSLVKFMKTDAAEAARIFAERGVTPETAKWTSRFGTNYYERYLQLFGGLGGNLNEDAMYFWVKKDQNNAVLNGNNRYVIHLEKAQIPPTKAFWSLTLYNKDFLLPMGLPMNRHVRNSSSGMKMNPDGSLDIYLQADSPGMGKEDNWLPTPKEDYFIVMRVYWPGEEVLNGTWKVPVAKKLP